MIYIETTKELIILFDSQVNNTFYSIFFLLSYVLILYWEHI